MMHKNISLIFAVLFMLGSCGQKNEKLRRLKEKPKRRDLFCSESDRENSENICLGRADRKKGDTLAQLDVPEVSAK